MTTVVVSQDAFVDLDWSSKECVKPFQVTHLYATTLVIVLSRAGECVLLSRKERIQAS